VRRLESNRERKEIIAALWRFASAVDGAQYKFGLNAILHGLSPTWIQLASPSNKKKSLSKDSGNHGVNKKKLKQSITPTSTSVQQQPPPPLNSPPLRQRRRQSKNMCCGQASHNNHNFTQGTLVDDDYDNINPTFFCSQLVARALQVAAVIRHDLSADAFWPGTFSVDAKVAVDNLLLSGHSYGPEVFVDTTIIEVAHSSAHLRSPHTSIDSSRAIASPLTCTPRSSARSNRRLSRRSSSLGSFTPVNLQQSSVIASSSPKFQHHHQDALPRTPLPHSSSPLIATENNHQEQ